MLYLNFLYRQLCVRPQRVDPSISLQGQVMLITGANSGIGLETARHCVDLNASTVILAVRSEVKGDAAKADILQSRPNSKTTIEIWKLDLESLDSVVQFGRKIQQLPRLDVAILNAGVFKFDWSVTTDKLESSLQVNHVSTALLSLLVLPPLRRTAHLLKKPSRLTFSSSEVHMWTPFREQHAEHILDRFNDSTNFTDYLDHYSVSKLLNVFWDRELSKRINPQDVIVNFVNPGSVNTGLHRDNKLMQVFDWIIGRTPEEGGRLLMDAAFVKGVETHGQYLSEAKVIEVSSFVRSTEGAKIQEQLWRETRLLLEQKLATEEVGEAFTNII